MSKELEAFRDILGILSAISGCEVDTDSERIRIVQQALQRLQAIDNANPSEALECWKKIDYKVKYECSCVGDDDLERLTIIKQALIKSEKEHKALEILKQNVKVSIDYGEEKDISFALVFYIDNKKTIYVVDEAIKEQNPEHFKELELLKEVLGE